MNALDTPIRDVMVTDPAAVHPTQHLAAVRHGMIAAGGHHVPVVDDGRFVGLLAAADLMLMVEGNPLALQPAELDAALRRVTVREAMNEDVLTIQPDRTVRDAIRQFVRGGFHSLPVVDAQGRLVGLVTTTDVLRLVLNHDAVDRGEG